MFDVLEITYDRQARQYRWTDPESGEILTAPAKQKAELFRAVVGMLDPDVYAVANRLVQKYPYMERYIWRGVELVINDAVEVFAAPAGDVIAVVESSDVYGRYAIRHNQDGLSCECESFTGFTAPMTETGQMMCKHLLAVKIWQFARETRF
jgi:hypothetical protein